MRTLAALLVFFGLLVAVWLVLFVAWGLGAIWMGYDRDGTIGLAVGLFVALPVAFAVALAGGLRVIMPRVGRQGAQPSSGRGGFGSTTS